MACSVATSGSSRESPRPPLSAAALLTAPPAPEQTVISGMTEKVAIGLQRDGPAHDSQARLSGKRDVGGTVRQAAQLATALLDVAARKAEGVAPCPSAEQALHARAAVNAEPDIVDEAGLGEPPPGHLAMAELRTRTPSMKSAARCSQPAPERVG